ncbi:MULTISPECIES: preprotein translocase subunit YajC [Prosthecochloris]|uniref:Sec translocon accessory complex subunit YajC n=1 Tax=Prosthecochloris vibrioformis TaxID=1098 RepID=A0A5C4S2P1_PROVB|nr:MULTISPECIES: preprotein translocase subunit YajC [Prosthecochloris]ANT65873.1 preprotein translocase subunit YajC [Prosthecochloris sp. CIB 2401]TNJ37760.1 preprotein translocase subunit YajC [Prosthecochloris vibrioformis]
MHQLIAALVTFAPPSGGTTPNPFVQLVPLALIFIVFYFFLIRPQQKKQKEREKVLDSLKRGDKVVTIGGMHGTVAGIDAEKKTVLIQIAEGMKVTFDRSAVANIEKQEAGEKLSSKKD